MNHKIFLTGLALFLSIGIFASLSRTFAQDGVNNAVPGAETSLEESGSMTGVTTADEVFNPLWLLPLIAIPLLLFMLWPRNKHSDAMGDHQYAGAKGGRAEEQEDSELFESTEQRKRDEVI